MTNTCFRIFKMSVKKFNSNLLISTSAQIPCLSLQIIHFRREDYLNKRSNTKQGKKLFSAIM